MELHKSHNLPSAKYIDTELTTAASNKTDLCEILNSLQEEKNPKLTMGMFFEFMKTAYQVKDSLENLNITLNASSEIDWNALTKINLQFKMHNDNVIPDKGIDPLPGENHNSKSQISKATDFRKADAVQEKLHTQEVEQLKQTRNNHLLMSERQTTSRSPDVNQTNFAGCNESLCKQFDADGIKDINHVGETEHILTTVLKKNLGNILHEGILDSVLPYMIPKSVLSQPNIKKSIINTEVRKSSSLNANNEVRSTPSLYKEKDKEKNKSSRKSMENEVEIHVCDEDKNIKKNFRCPQQLLIQKMCYFADVTAGQKLEEIDISVHCDVVIFDWLMRWVKKDIISKSEWPVLEANNVIPIMVSASFLQMEPLLENCLEYCHSNMSDILKTSTILTCLDDNLMTREQNYNAYFSTVLTEGWATLFVFSLPFCEVSNASCIRIVIEKVKIAIGYRLAEQFTNEEVEALKDKRDKIQSKLFCKLITLLAEATPNGHKGHHSSLSTLFKCNKCGKNIVQSISDYVPCIPSAMKVDSNGIMHSKHVRDVTWTLNDYILMLRGELRSWRKVYWRLWSDCHFLFCQQCNIYFPVHQMGWCCYHPELPQFFINEQQRPTPFPLGRYPCCSQRAYRFEALPNREGCRYKEHIPDIRTQKDVNILNIFTVHQEIIAMEPPQLFFPEKITRLVARDPSLQPGKLLCKDIMWWSGLELVPPRIKLGLLAKIWNGFGYRRSLQTHDSQKLAQRLRQQYPVTRDNSPTPSITDSDDERVTDYEDSSIDEESCYSEESNAWMTLKSASKTKQKSKAHCVQRNSGRCWSGNLNVRHNQDNQRDFEERASVQMMTLLTRRIFTDFVILKSPNKHSWKKNQPIGGIYVKLEAEFREQFNQFHKHKNSSGKSSIRIKSNK